MDRARFNDCYVAYRSHVRSTARRAGIPEAEVDDVVQDVFCVLLVRSSMLEPESSLQPWLFGVTRLVCRNYRRSYARRTKGLSYTLDQPAGHDYPDPTSASPHECHERQQVLQRVLAALGDDQRAVLRLACVEGYSASEIGRRLGLSPNTVSSRLRLARSTSLLRLKTLER